MATSSATPQDETPVADSSQISTQQHEASEDAPIHQLDPDDAKPTEDGRESDGAGSGHDDGAGAEDEDEDDNDDEDEDEEEPRLKYAPLTRNLPGVYRNSDLTSTFLVAGDKMVIGTHNGHVHVFAMPSLQLLKQYKAHQASVTAISISPYPPPLPIPTKLDATQRLAAESAQEDGDRPITPTSAKGSPSRTQAQTKGSPKPPVPQVPKTPSNEIYIATASMDGNVCIQNLVDHYDVQRRNFGRPLQAVALSPEYKTDKTYVSGGQAGSLIITVGGQTGKSANATTTGATAAASGWLGSIGLGANTGTDRVVHSGEGTIHTIKWSLSGKYVLWITEQSIKIIRTHVKLVDQSQAWDRKKIMGISRPNKKGWDEIAAVQKARAEWIDRESLELLEKEQDSNVQKLQAIDTPKTNAAEEVVVGWGNMACIIKVVPGKEAVQGQPDTSTSDLAERTRIIWLDDGIVSGLSMYSPTVMLVLAHREKRASSKKALDNKKSVQRRRFNGLEPELRLIDINTMEEVENDTLPVKNFEKLSASDYHLGVLHPVRIPAHQLPKGYMSTLGSGMTTAAVGLYQGVEAVGQLTLDATLYAPRKLGANRLFRSDDASSIQSGSVAAEKSPNTKGISYLTGWIPGIGIPSFNIENEDLKAMATTHGLKIFIFSPFDCIAAVKRTLADRVQWLEDKQLYEQAWELLDEHPEAAASASEPSEASSPPTPSKASSFVHSTSDSITGPNRQLQKPTLAEFFADTTSMTTPAGPGEIRYTGAEKEKRRLGELWLQQLTTHDQWSRASEVASKVLNTTPRWEYWAGLFLKRGKFDDISQYLPAMELTPPISASIYETILGHYVQTDRGRFKELVDLWPSDLFDISSITTLIQNELSGDETVSPHSLDWRLLNECLAKLFLADGHYKEALHCYILLQDADTAMSLVKDHHLVEAIADDIRGLVLLRISRQQLKSAKQSELEALSKEPIQLLVDEATHGVVEPDQVVLQLERANLNMFLFFYLSMLWKGEASNSNEQTGSFRHRFATDDLAADEGKLIVEQFADKALTLFAEYNDRPLLMDFLHTSTAYTYSKALSICDKKKFIPEEVYLLSKTGSLKKALLLIIDELGDVSKAIQFAKEQNDPGLWEDLLDYSMSRPQLISGLLSGIGTSIDPIKLIERIPNGIEVEGLKEGLSKMIREYDLLDSISLGVAKVLASEVAVGMDTLRKGRRKGIKFDVVSPKRAARKADLESTNGGATEATPQSEDASLPTQGEIEAGYCASCHKAFNESELDTLIGFACGHIYHFQHLFREPGKENEVIELDVPRYTKDGDDDDAIYESTTRSIASKVTNARLLQDKIQMAGGCKVCRQRRDKIKEVS